jgi:hypothetical protein
MVRVAMIILDMTEDYSDQLAYDEKLHVVNKRARRSTANLWSRIKTYPNLDRSDSSPPSSHTPPLYALPLALWS